MKTPAGLDILSDWPVPNTLACPSLADTALILREPEHISNAVEWAETQGLRFRVIGSGSNLLPSERLGGLTLKLAMTDLLSQDLGNGDVRVSVGAGVLWNDLVQHTVRQGLFGLENLALIPGTVGAAPVQNIGAYGRELADVLESVEVYDPQQQQYAQLSREACQFGYRQSLFKTEKGRHLIIYRVHLRLKTQASLHLDYADLRARWLDKGGEETPLAVAELVSDLRRSKLPDPGDMPNAGSFFKNPVVSADQAEALKAQWPAMVTYPTGNGAVKLAAGWLIEQAGWKGYESGGLGCYHRQALVLVNPGKRPASDVLGFADAIRQSVKGRFGVDLEQEPGVLS